MPKVGPFNLGMNNRLPSTELVIPKEGTFLHSAVNVDITTPGTVKRRQGTALVLAGTDVHSFWADRHDAYVVDGTVLYSLNEAADTKTSVRTGMTPGRRVSYTRLNGNVIYTDGNVLRRLAGNIDAPFGVRRFDAEPRVAAGGVGTLVPGLYQVCFAYFDDNLQQSGTTVPVQVNVAAGQAIVITGLPAAFPADVGGVMVYMTPPNGDQLYLERALVAAATTLTISTVPQLGGRCQTLLMEPMPAGAIVRGSNGRLLVARGSYLHYSEPFAPALCNPNKGFIAFDSDVTVIEPVKTGVFVATEDATYFLAGDIAEAELDKKLPYGGVLGSGGCAPDNLRCWWMSARGLVVANADGSVKNVQEDQVVVDPATAGASLYREKDGMKQFIATNFGAGISGAAAYDFMDAEVIRQGVTL